MIEEIVNAFLIKNKKKILQAQNKELTAKVAAQMKTIQELTKVAEKEKKNYLLMIKILFKVCLILKIFLLNDK
jgi:hypothetical protein